MDLNIYLTSTGLFNISKIIIVMVIIKKVLYHLVQQLGYIVYIYIIVFKLKKFLLENVYFIL